MTETAPRLTLNTGPAEQLVQAATQEVTIKDALGRSIVLKKPPILAQFRFIEILGDTASNGTYVAMTLPLLFVASIDGEPVLPPMKKSEIEALIQRLDESGVAAVAAAVEERWSGQDAEAAKAAAKK